MDFQLLLKKHQKFIKTFFFSNLNREPDSMVYEQFN